MSVKFTLGGIKRELRIELALATKFEDATGLGYLQLVRQVVERTAKLSDVVEVLRIAFEANGTKFSSAELLELIRHDGIVNAYVVAGLLVMELCLRPGEAPTGKAARTAREKIADTQLSS